MPAVLYYGVSFLYISGPLTGVFYRSKFPKAVRLQQLGESKIIWFGVQIVILNVQNSCCFPVHAHKYVCFSFYN